MLSGLRTALCSMKASAAYGRALRFQRKGQEVQALKAARHGLTLLGQPYVLREHPWSSSVLAFLTIFVEHFAQKTGTSGASELDLRDSLKAFKVMSESLDKSGKNYQDEIRYLESRLQEIQS